MLSESSNRTATAPTVQQAFQLPGYADFGDDHKLAPLRSATRQAWLEKERPAVRKRWLELLGRPSFDSEGFEYSAEKTGSLDGIAFSVHSWRQITGPGQQQKVFILEPRQRASSPAPCAVIPYYHPEKVCGLRMNEDGSPLQWLDDAEARESEVRMFGAHLARMGFVVACVEAFPFNTIAKPAEAVQRPFAWWEQAADQLLSDHPNWTGMGKLVHDTSRALDLLLKQCDVDPGRVLIMGHSLGGKMAFYTGALDERITCTVGSDFGLPWKSTNWHADWYLGSRIPADDSALAHHELLSLVAPRAFFLIAGQTDNRSSWQYIEAARKVYSLFETRHKIGGIDHASGHAPTIAALEVTYNWIREEFQLSSPMSWR